MSTFKKKDLNELVGGDINSNGGDRNPVSNSEIETGPVNKPYNDNSDYEKGQQLTTDKVFSRYRQDIPWFAVYSYASNGNRGLGMNENNKKIFTKKTVEEKIEDLVKKSNSLDVTEKNYNPKISKLIDYIKDNELSDKQLEELDTLIKQKTNIKKA